MRKNFNDIYEEIYKDGFQKLQKLKIERNMSVIIGVITFILIIILTAYFLNYNILIIGAILLIIIVLSYANKSSEYKVKFKNLVIKPIVNLCSSKLFFIYKSGINTKEYCLAEFDQGVNRVYSEDLIEGDILENTHLKMSQVKAVNYTDTSHGKNDIVIFNGIFGYSKLKGKKISKIDIKPNDWGNEFKISRLEIDSAEFEKQYDILADNRLQAMRIFNSEVIEQINRFKEETGHVIQIRIMSDVLFFRIPCINAFDAPLVRDTLDYGTLYEYYKMIKLPIDIMEKIIENIEQLDI